VLVTVAGDTGGEEPVGPELVLLGPLDVPEPLVVLEAAELSVVVAFLTVAALPEPLVVAGLLVVPELVGPELRVLVLLVMRFVVVAPSEVEALAVPANSAQKRVSAKAILQVKEIARRPIRRPCLCSLKRPIAVAASSPAPIRVVAYRNVFPITTE
jgi:hypothetical protein